MLRTALGDKGLSRAVASVSRLHIVAIAAAGSLVFGWLLTGAFHPWLAVLVAADWFLVNLVNRVVDAEEDRKNEIPFTDFAQSNSRRIYLFALAIYVLTFGVHLVWLPILCLPRAVLHALGLLYNFELLPGRRRLKAMYFFKNSASCVGFLVSLFVYPIVAFDLRPEPLYVALPMLQFALFETSFEVIYDLRDVVGDAHANVPTYPVVHGVPWARSLIVALDLGAIVVGLSSAAAGIFGLAETIMVFGPCVQLWLFVRGVRRGFSAADCVTTTWTFMAMELGFVAWVLLGLPVALERPLTSVEVVDVGLVVLAFLCWCCLRGSLGDRGFLQSYVVIAAGAWLCENTAIEWYRYYRYAPDWTVFVGHVPLEVLLIWPLVILSAQHLVGRLGHGGVAALALGSGLIAVEAILIEVVCVQAGLWSWVGAGLFGVPLIGPIGWGLFGFAALAALQLGRWWSTPLVGFVVVHAGLNVLWWAGFSHLSHLAIPPAAALASVAIAVIAASSLALRHRRRLAIGVAEVVPRIGASALIFYLLATSKPEGAAALFCVSFALPYLLLFELRWGVEGDIR